MTCTTLQQPYYSHPCDIELGSEDTTRYVHRYVAAIRVANNWTIPAEMSIAVLDVPALTEVLLGSWLWHPVYGYFEIQSYDPISQQIGIGNYQLAGNALPGTPVPACTQFIISPRPYGV